MTNHDYDLDLELLPQELTRALWAAGYAPALMEPGLSLTAADPDDTCGVIDCHGVELCRLDLATLRRKMT